MVGSGTTSKAATDGKDQFERLLQLTQEIASLARVKKGLDLKISDHYDRVKRRVIVEILTINSQHHAGSDYRLTRVVVKLPRHMMSYPMERVARELFSQADLETRDKSVKLLCQREVEEVLRRHRPKLDNLLQTRASLL